MNLASQVTGQTLFDVWDLENPRDMPPQLLIRPYKKVDISEGAIFEALETICDVCDALIKTHKTHESAGRPDLVSRTHTILLVYLMFVTI